MDNTRNALAELAERLLNHAEYLYGNNNKASDDVSKSQRIVAELAKVSEGRWVEYCGSKLYLCRLGGHVIEMAVGKCRAIAEEEKKSET